MSIQGHNTGSKSTVHGQALPWGVLVGEWLIGGVFAIAALVPLVIILALLAVFLIRSWHFFQVIPPWDFFTDLQWSPLFPNRYCGIWVLAIATLMIVAIALTVAIPCGVLAAIYLSEYAPPPVRRVLKPTLEALSGVPTVVYGYFALLLLTPLLKTWLPFLGTFNALSAGLITGVLITPTISSLSEDAIRNVPRPVREASYALGMTRRELVIHSLLPMAFPGIVAAITLAASQALGETMIAAIAAGQNPNLTLNPLVPVESITAFIIQVSLGDVPPNSFVFDTIFTIGFVLFLFTLALNWFGHWLVWQYHQRMNRMIVPHADSPDPLHPLIGLPDIRSNKREVTKIPSSSPDFQRPLPLDRSGDRLFHLTSLGAALLGLVVLSVLVWGVVQVGIPRLSWDFLTRLASRDPEQAGILAALMGTCILLLLTAAVAFPIGIGAAVFFEEYLPINRWSHLLEIHLANLAAVPSILYGLLGLALFTRWLRPLTGGRSLLSAALVMAVVVLPVVTIATRSALRAVPASQRQAAYAVGMVRWQMIYHVLLPSALPGMITGMLLALSRAAGETAALLPIGAAAFVSFAPDLTWLSLHNRFTTLTTQIFYWVLRPQAEFHSLAAATILVLGGLVLLVNIIAVLLRDWSRQSPHVP